MPHDVAGHKLGAGFIVGQQEHKPLCHSQDCSFLIPEEPATRTLVTALKYLSLCFDSYIRSRPLLILTMRRMQSARMAAAMTNSTMATALGWPETVRNRTPTAVRNAVIMSSMETAKSPNRVADFPCSGSGC